MSNGSSKKSRPQSERDKLPAGKIDRSKPNREKWKPIKHPAHGPKRKAGEHNGKKSNDQPETRRRPFTAIFGFADAESTPPSPPSAPKSSGDTSANDLSLPSTGFPTMRPVDFDDGLEGAPDPYPSNFNSPRKALSGQSPVGSIL